MRMLIAAAALLLALTSFAQTPANLSDREIFSLNGDWQVIVDPFDHGTIDYLSRPYDLFRRPPVEDDGFDLVEYAWDDDHTLRVPGDWNSQRPELLYYEGAVWYRKTFRRSDLRTDLDRVWLCFGGANRVATVWLNGKELGEHRVGFTPFAFDITDHVREGQNDVVVRVNARRAPDAVPGMMYDWWNYGGLTRDVWLAAASASPIESWQATLTDDGIRVWVDAADAEQTVRVSLPELGQTITTTTNDQGRAAVLFQIGEDLVRWSPESPRLYDIEIESEGDLVRDRVGFRTIETRRGEILLNGEPVFLRGISIHEESPLTEGRATSEEDARVLLGWAKELGCNYVRLAHYTHNEHTVRVAEELGLMVWAEIPVYWVLDYENPETLDEARTHLREMIDRDRNRANIVIWSIGNETGDAPEVTRFRRALGEYLKELDPSRLLSAAMFASQKREQPGHGKPGSAGSRLTKLVVDDPFGEIADVLAINQYVGWYHDRPDEIGAVEVELMWDKPFVISEFGVGVKQGRRGDRDQRWTEEFGVWLYEETLEWSETIPNLAGMSPWILQDFRSPRRLRYGIQDWYNRKGLISETGIKKDVFGVLQRHYRSLADTQTND